MAQSLDIRIQEALQIIEDLSLETIELGKYVVNENFYYVVQEYETKDVSEARYEAHKQYVDIQYIIGGKEAIGITPATALVVEQEYEPETDVMFFEAPEQSAQAVLSAGGYVILYPQDAHRPGVKVGEKPGKVRKVVGKVRVMAD